VPKTARPSRWRTPTEPVEEDTSLDFSHIEFDQVIIGGEGNDT
jgi:hypothetical protein